MVGGSARGEVDGERRMDDNVHRWSFVSITILLTLLIVWTCVWTLDRDPAFYEVGEPAWVPPPNEPTNAHGASKFWAGRTRTVFSFTVRWPSHRIFRGNRGEVMALTDAVELAITLVVGLVMVMLCL